MALPDINTINSLYQLFENNWIDQVTFERSFPVKVIKSADNVEQRRMAGQKPKRTVETMIKLSESPDELRNMRSLRAYSTISKWYCPIFSDIKSVSNASIATNTVITVDETANTEFAVGNKAVILRDDQNFYVYDINAIASTTITLTGTAPSFTPEQGDYIFPVMVSEPVLKNTAQNITDYHQRFSLKGVEDGENKLEAITLPGTNPSGFDTYNTLPVLNADHNFSVLVREQLEFMATTDIATDLANSFVSYADRPSATFTVSSQNCTREDIYKLRSFFDSRGAGCYPFYLIDPSTSLTVTEVTVGGFKVNALGSVDDWDLKSPYVYIEYKDGTKDYREITNVARVSGEDELTTETGLSQALENIERATSLYLCRFDSNKLTETWTTDTISTSSLKIRELVEYQENLTIANLSLLTAPNSPESPKQNRCILSQGGGDPVSGNTLMRLYDGGASIDGDRVRVTVNGSVLYNDLTLSAAGTSIPMNSFPFAPGENTVNIRALNEGGIPPNTCTIDFIPRENMLEGFSPGALPYDLRQDPGESETFTFFIFAEE